MRSLVGCSVGLIALFALPAQATSLLRADVPRLAVHSSRVVRGSVVRIEAHWTKDGRHIVTDVTVKVAETLAGHSASTVVIRQPGGVVGDIGQRVSGVARFRKGEQVVVFLERRGPRFRLTGMAQGKFHLEASTNGPLAVPSPTEDAVLIDPSTHRPTVAHLRPMPLAVLRAKVRRARAKSHAGRSSHTRGR